ncbi:MAG: tetratricopeptide repeat protein [Prochloron sp. SP5CPC1]|nr:tetratricopeptide repeat protein [Candidatus Paraprochloron terpiosi SP5CPC1]
MKESQTKRNRWLYVVIVLAILALLSFSILPVLSSVTGRYQSQTTTQETPAQVELATQAKGYELVLQREPENQTALLGLLESKLKLGDITGALAPLEKLADLNPNQPDYRILLAQAQEQVGEDESAADNYRTVLASHPANMNAIVGMVNLLLKQDRPQAAISLVEDTLSSEVRSNSEESDTGKITGLQLLLGQIYASQKRYPEAIAVYDQGIESNPQDFRPLLAKAMILVEQGKEEEAKPLFNKALSLAPPEYKDQIQQMAAKRKEIMEELTNSEQ